MPDKSTFVEDVGLENLPFPMRVPSRENAEGQPTIANVSVSVRIMSDFQAEWIHRFVQILHQHDNRIAPKILKYNILDYLTKLSATAVQVNFEYPFFMEKLTPVSREKCLVRYLCTYAAKASKVGGESVRFKIQVPAMTTYPGSSEDKASGLFGQMSVVTIELTSDKDIFPEDLVDLVDKYAISPVYSFLTEADQDHIIEKLHSVRKTSVELVDDIKRELSHSSAISWYSVNCANFGMLHSYSTVIGIEKSPWIPST